LGFGRTEKKEKGKNAHEMATRHYTAIKGFEERAEVVLIAGR